MSSSPRRCKTRHGNEQSIRGLEDLTWLRFVECEAWRKETKLDEVLPTWEYPEKGEISKYYKQFYHKTDKVRCAERRICCAYPARTPLPIRDKWLISPSTGWPTPLH